MNTLPANFPELSLLLALLLSVVFWNVVRLVLAVLARRVRPSRHRSAWPDTGCSSCFTQ